MNGRLILIALILFIPVGVVRSLHARSESLPQSATPVWCIWGFHFGHNLVLATSDSLYKATNQGWKNLSPPITGIVSANSAGTIYLVGFRYELQPAPIYRSTDGGVTWTRQGEGPFNGVIPSPKPDWVFATSGHNDPTDGIYKSTDGGVTWKHVFQWPSGSISFSPVFAQDGIAFAVAGGSILKTNTWGETWLPVYPVYPSSQQPSATRQGSGENFVRPQVPWEFGWVVVSPQFPQDHTAFAGGGVLGLYKTTDGGDSWFKLAEYPKPTYGALVFSPRYLYDHTLLLAQGNGEQGDGIYLSHDGGLTWEQVGDGRGFVAGIREQGPFGSPAVTPSPPAGPHFLYFPFLGRGSGTLEFWVVRAPEEGGNCYLYRSHDEGVTWQAVSVFEAAHWQYLPRVSRGPAP